jgi:hypothetical protein
MIVIPRQDYIKGEYNDRYFTRVLTFVAKFEGSRALNAPNKLRKPYVYKTNVPG